MGLREYYSPTFQHWANLQKNWVKVFYTNIESTVMNNGFSGGWLKIKIGVQKGCQVSIILFIICVEPLAVLISNDEEIK